MIFTYKMFQNLMDIKFIDDKLSCNPILLNKSINNYSLLMTTQLQIKKKRGNKTNSPNRSPPKVRAQREMWYQEDEYRNQPVGRGPIVSTRPIKDRSSDWGNNVTGQEWTKAQKVSQQYQLVDDNLNAVTKFIENQVILMEPSPVKKKLEELRKLGKKFVDERFPPNNNSLCGEVGTVKAWKWVEWANISDKIPRAKIFSGKIQPQDIQQGILGDCYFLAGLAALAERPDRIFNLFLTQQTNDLCYYSVKMLYQGKWIVIDMDEKIPWLYTKPAFSNTVDNQLWVILLEKAWAKMYSSYRRIDAGYPQEPLHDLTGAPIREIRIKKGNYDKREEWQYLLQASRLQYSMVCSSNPGSDSDKSQSGVVQGHAYTLLKVDTLQFDRVEHKLVQLRNPWGEGEFKGQWSQKDKNWNKISKQEKQRLGYFEKEDGIFFMPFDDFWREFRTITIAQINDDASYVYKSAKDKNQQGVYFKVDIKKEGIYSLQIDKTPQRAFEEKIQDSYQYPHTIVELGLINSRTIEKLKGFADDNRTTQKKYRLTPGIYIVKVLMDFDTKFEKDFDVNLAIYSEYPCIIQLASNQQACLLAGKRVNWTGQELKETESWNPLGAYGYKQDEDSSEESEEYGYKNNYKDNTNNYTNNNSNYTNSYDKNYTNSYDNSQKEYKPQSISFEQLWLKTSAKKDSSGRQESPKVKNDNRIRTQTNSSAVMQLLKHREKVASLFSRQDQRQQQSSATNNNQKTQYSRWQF